MQIDQNSANLVSPFRSQDIAFSIMGTQECQVVSKLLTAEKLLLSGKTSLKWQEEYARGKASGKISLKTN